jgi:Protein of unknown function (DUF1549)/Protein of unknown function (DUF1553)
LLAVKLLHACFIKELLRTISVKIAFRTYQLPYTLLTQYFVLMFFAIAFCNATFAQVSDLQPRVCRPGETTKLTLVGTELDKSLRLLSSHKRASFAIESVTPEQATVAMTLPADAGLGPMGISTATLAATNDPWILVVDDLPMVAREANNTSRQTAQQITPQCCIAGAARGAQSDFYRFQVEAGTQLSFEIITQGLHSAMDPMLRLMTLDGKLVKAADEDGVGPEAKFSYRFEQAGDFILEVLDSRYTAGGSYHLRIGDFPILASSQPAAIQRGQTVTVNFSTSDGQTAQPTQVAVAPNYLNDTLLVSTKQVGGQSSAWRPLHVSDLPVIAVQPSAAPSASTESVALTIPSCVCGQLTQPKQQGVFKLRGIKDQTLTIRSRTRSLRSPTLLKMQLLNGSGAKVAETAVSKEDEWSFEYKFPDDAEYSLVVSDMLGRGGPEFAYVVEVRPKDSYSLAMKGDAKVIPRYFVDSARGAVAIELLVKRNGYEGEIDLAIVADSVDQNPASGLKILNPTIAAGAKEARVYLSVAEGWTPQRLDELRLIGRAKSQPGLQSVLSNVDIQRLQRPHIPFPQSWSDGLLVLAAKPAIDPLFSLETATPTKLARHIAEQPTTLTLKRINSEFKAGVTLLTQRLPAGWSASFKADKDAFATTVTRSAVDPASELPEIELLMFAEHNGQAFLDSVKLPVQWFDPISVDVQLPKSVVAGSTIPVTIAVQRSIAAAPITLSWKNLPSGIQLPETVTIPADQTSTVCELKVLPEVAPQQLQLNLAVASKLNDKDFSFAVQTSSFEVQKAPTRLEVFPEKVALSNGRAKRQLVVTGFDAAGASQDWTSKAQFVSSNPQIAEVRNGIVYPKADGEVAIVAKVGSAELSIPVAVSQYSSIPRTDFESEVLVALSKQGCNAGACHGSPSGKAMFRLSLRAFDRQLDELTLIREDFGRRINSVEPSQSLLLLKPMMKVTHGGGKQIRKEDAAYKVLEAWIREGGKPDPAGVARCVRLEVYPNSKRTLSATGGSQQLSVLAHFADGTQRDVTDLAVYESSNQQIASIDAVGRVAAKGRGEVVILVRFLEHIESVRLACIDPDPQFQWQSPTPNNYVDELVYEKLKSAQYLPADICSDAEFLRRVHLDLIGVLPTVDETRSFLGDAGPDKRARLVDSLLERPEYAKFWALKWGDLLKLTGKLVGNEAVLKYYRWIEESLRNDMPYDQFARQLLTASGSTLSNPPANFYRTATDMNECVETVSQVFLGARLQCAKCHNHPFERWTQDNYYGLAAFFNRVGRRETLRPGEMFILPGETGEVTQPRTGQQMKPWLPSQGSVDPPADQDRRQLFAQWLTQAGNPFFAKIGANRIWSHLFARGIVDPVDDFRDSNPATNEPLLAALANDFQQHNYSNKHLLRTILNSRTYQASYQTSKDNREDTQYFSHQQPRMLKAEQLLDAVNATTGVSQVFGPLPADWKATQLPAPDLVKVDFLKVFGQPERSTVCACERSSDSNLAMAIELFNGPLIHERLRDPNNRFRKALAAGMTQDAVLDELYLAGLCRLPNEAERTAANNHLAQRDDKAAAFEDICWAMLNTDEFLFQH